MIAADVVAAEDTRRSGRLLRELGLVLKYTLETHVHADHINGFAVLLFQLSLVGYKQTLRVYGNEPTLALVQRVVAAFELGKHQVPVEWIVVRGGEERFAGREPGRVRPPPVPFHRVADHTIRP